MKYIVTHPGSAHKDEFLSCSLLIAENRVPVFRREPTEDELNDDDIAVVDIGMQHDPALLNFDHHQFASDSTPACALTLVLKHLGVYEDARAFCPWLETAEWLDVRGARTTAEWLGIPPVAVAQLSSPLDFTMLRLFAADSEHQPGTPVWDLAHRVGSDLLGYVRSLRANIIELQKHVTYWPVMDLEVCFAERKDDLSPGVMGAMDQMIRELGRPIAATITPDARRSGYKLKRFEDNPRIDFTRIADQPDVHFAHSHGFVAKTEAIDPERLKELLHLSCHL